MSRVFVALWPPAEAAAGLSDLANDCASRFGGRATRRETIHLTLAFIGEMPSARLPVLIEVLDRVAAEPFELRIDRLGYWPHNRLLWAGCSHTPEALQTLVASLNRELLDNGFAVARPNEAFVAHLTLVRKLPHRNLPGMTEQLPEVQGISWQCRHLVLVESTLSPSGSSYRQLAVFHIDS
ncbi:RNA 2',3'-cyclic phosphodiesterase [Azonexus sp. IMCC34839]|uniref:RNA 2',3'-cyclic phosphodiesterase n=1 Tax=Azonexus sp. IMCC34839 TaxID=3133695 RepID=UPI0039999660